MLVALWILLNLIYNIAHSIAKRIDFEHCIAVECKVMDFSSEPKECIYLAGSILWGGVCLRGIPGEHLLEVAQMFRVYSGYTLSSVCDRLDVRDHILQGFVLWVVSILYEAL